LSETTIDDAPSANGTGADGHTDGMIGIVDVCSETGLERGVVNRFLAEDEIREWLGGKDTHPKYPASSMPLFHWMAGKYRAGVKPKMLAVGLKNPDAPGQDGELPPLLPPAVPPPPKNGMFDIRLPDEAGIAVIGQIAEIVAQRFGGVLIEQIAASRLLPAPEERPIVEDKLLTRDQAAELLACDPAAVGRYVKPARGGASPAWSHRMVQNCIAEARRKAEEKETLRQQRRRRLKVAQPAANTDSVVRTGTEQEEQ
jgi:hypothetical protein